MKLAALLLAVVVCTTTSAPVSEVSRMQNELERLRQEVYDMKLEQQQIREAMTEKRASVAFFVVQTNNVAVTGGANIPYNDVRLNLGGGWVSGQSHFVAPQAGVYAFSFGAGAVDETCVAGLYLNDGPSIVQALGSNTQSTWRQGANSAVLDLAAGDRVATRCVTSATLYGNQKWPAFSGFLVA